MFQGELLYYKSDDLEVCWDLPIHRTLIYAPVCCVECPEHNPPEHWRDHSRKGRYEQVHHHTHKENQSGQVRISRISKLKNLILYTL